MAGIGARIDAHHPRRVAAAFTLCALIVATALLAATTAALAVLVLLRP